jgi:hypothetical protein
MLGVLSYFPISAIGAFVVYGGGYSDFPSTLLRAALFTFPILVIMGPIFLIYVLSSVGGKGLVPDYVAYAACLGCVVIEYLYLAGFADV